MEAQRFPDDFDGIIAGSPGNNWTHMETGFLWNERAVLATAAGDLSQSVLDTLSDAVLKQCVGKDGGLPTDTFLTNPPACRFEPQRLLCRGQNAGACLTQDKITAVEKIFAGPAGIFPGYLTGKGETNNAADWPTWITGDGTSPASAIQIQLANSFFADLVFPNTGWTPQSHSIEDSVRAADAKLAAILNSTDPDLTPFKRRGGKLIQYVGWSDTGIAPQNDIDYHAAVTQALGGPRNTSNFYRLFMVPGMAHCSGGPGASAFGQSVNGPDPTDPADDVISALDNWVENGGPPDTIVTTKYVNDDPAQGVAFQRPLCPYPQSGAYRSGDPQSAASFACVTPPDGAASAQR